MVVITAGWERFDACWVNQACAEGPEIMSPGLQLPGRNVGQIHWQVWMKA